MEKSSDNTTKNQTAAPESAPLDLSGGFLIAANVMPLFGAIFWEKNIRFCLDENHPVLTKINPYVYKYPRELRHFGLPIIVLILAIWTYKLKTFEFKFAFFVFTSIFSIIQQWFFR